MATRAATNHNDQPPRITTETSVAAVESLDLSALSERIVRENGDGIGFKFLVNMNWRSLWSAVAPKAPPVHPFSLLAFLYSGLRNSLGRSRRSDDPRSARLQIWPSRGRITPPPSRRRPARRATRRGC